MTHILHGDRIARQGKVRLGCSAVLFDPSRQKVLLTRRSDNGQWCLPGGSLDPGESVSEACEREFQEETGLQVRVVRLTGVYSSPDRLVVYPDGNRAHIVALNFEVQRIGGEATLSEETTGLDWFPTGEAVEMKLFSNHAERVRDALTGQAEAFVR